ncbi:hypothetical protein EJB05_15666, partial [Eragrostis curvula]
MAPDLPVVTTSNAEPVLASLPTPFRRVTYIEPGQSVAANEHIRILATAGPVLGPPWQRPENGFILLPNLDGSTSIWIREEEIRERGKRQELRA